MENQSVFNWEYLFSAWHAAEALSKSRKERKERMWITKKSVSELKKHGFDLSSAGNISDTYGVSSMLSINIVVTSGFPFFQNIKKNKNCQCKLNEKNWEIEKINFPIVKKLIKNIPIFWKYLWIIFEELGVNFQEFCAIDKKKKIWIILFW